MAVKRNKRLISFIGAGPASLMCAAHLDTTLFDVVIYEKNTAAGRKFLVAGDGGLNLTHSESPGEFIKRYTPNGFLDTCFSHFNNADLIGWFAEMGILTYTGTSGRIFPERNIKPIEVLNAIIARVERNGVTIKYRHEWKGWSDKGALLFETEGGAVSTEADITVFALGGSSWPVTGSTGSWLSFFSDRNIVTRPFQASNCSVLVDWPAELIKKYEGAPLKNIVISCGEMEHEGEVVITKKGIEGSGVYPLSPAIRDELNTKNEARLYFDLKPTATESEIRKKLAEGKGRNLSEKLRDALNLSHAQLALLKNNTTKEDFTDVQRLVSSIKKLPVTVTGLGPVEDAISTVGGIALEAIDEHFMLKELPGNYVIGEMLDYDAPTGGYLLQSCFSMGRYLAGVLNSRSGTVDEK